jgi:hypothetical protein
MSQARLKPILVVILIFLGITAGSIWRLSTSTKIANTEPAIQARWLARSIGVVPDGISPVKTVKYSGGRGWLYLLSGRLEAINQAEQLLVLVADNNQNFSYWYGRNLDADKNLDIWEQYNGRPAENKKITVEAVPLGSLVTVQWEDRRQLEAILAAAGQDPFQVINPDLTSYDLSRIMVKRL